MKTLLTTIFLIATTASALAHEAGVPHHHPHGDPTALIALGLIAAAGGYTLWRARRAAAGKVTQKRSQRP